MKKIRIYFLICIILCTVLSGCGNRNADMLEDAEHLSLSREVAQNPGEEDYGAAAYRYLRQIQDDYPGRTAGSEKEREMAVFILSVLLNGGYQESEISIQPFEIVNSIPMDAAEHVFSGGEVSERSQNIVVTREGESDDVILVGAHYDSAGTHGVDDNGSGVAVVLENALRMADEPTFYTIRYVFFGSEEIGLCGSREYVRSLSEWEKEHIVLMINADSILAGDHLYLYGGRVNGSGEVENAEAVLKAAEIAGEKGLNIQLPPEGNPDYPYPTGGSRSDHAPFGNAGIPYIYFAANNWESGTPVETERHGVIMHTDRDDLDFIEAEYGDRAKNTLASYSSLLYSLVREGEWK